MGAIKSNATRRPQEIILLVYDDLKSRPQNLQALADRYQVSYRTIHRYLKVYEAMNYNIVKEAGRYHIKPTSCRN
jgi:predicted DNA-binding transcriptional regulator YafY